MHCIYLHSGTLHTKEMLILWNLVEGEFKKYLA